MSRKGRAECPAFAVRVTTALASLVRLCLVLIKVAEQRR